MERIIHSVGQGAFYTEHFWHRDFNVAYDCGSYENGRGVRMECPNVLKGAINEADYNRPGRLDVLFISHFHLDHINGVIELLSAAGTNNTKIFLPSLTPDEKALYIVSAALTTGGGVNSYRIVVDTYKSFIREHGEQIVRVNDDTTENDSEPTDITTVHQSVFSGQELKLYDADWMYIPVVYKSDKFTRIAEKFVKALNDPKNGVSGIKIDKDGSIDNVGAKSWMIIKKIYKDLKTSSIENDLSMMVYSGPTRTATVRWFSYEGESLYKSFVNSIVFGDYMNTPMGHHIHHKPAALYVGDMEAKDAWSTLHKILSKIADGMHSSILDSIGLVQISHHGSMNDFNKALSRHLSKRIAFCCFGSENKYDHPSYLTLRHFLKKGTVVCMIDENDATLEEEIEIY